MADNNFQIECKKHLLAIHDTMDVLNGKWKVSIVATLCYHDKRRFSDILNDVKGISNKMLSKELKDLEVNKLVKRTVLDTKPITVQYELTEYGITLKPIINYLSDWGKTHRDIIIGK